MTKDEFVMEYRRLQSEHAAAPPNQGCVEVIDCQGCVDCVFCRGCHRCFHSRYSERCVDSSQLTHCVECHKYHGGERPPHGRGDPGRGVNVDERHKASEWMRRK